MKKHLQKFGSLYGGIFTIIGTAGILSAFALAAFHSDLHKAAFIGSFAVIALGLVVGLSDWE